MVDHHRHKTSLQVLGLAKVASTLLSRMEAQSSCLLSDSFSGKATPECPLEVGEARTGANCLWEQLLFLLGVSVSSSTTGLPDMTGSVYNKTQVREEQGGCVGWCEVHPKLALTVVSVSQTFDKQGFHAGTPPPFSLPSALGSTGPLAPGAAPGYVPPPFLHILHAHQQPHSQLLHHHLPQDAQVSPMMEAATLPSGGGSAPTLTAFSPPQSGSGQRSQPSSLQPKSQASKPAYGNSPYWTN